MRARLVDCACTCLPVAAFLYSSRRVASSCRPFISRSTAPGVSVRVVRFCRITSREIFVESPLRARRNLRTSSLDICETHFLRETHLARLANLLSEDTQLAHDNHRRHNYVLRSITSLQSMLLLNLNFNSRFFICKFKLLFLFLNFFENFFRYNIIDIKLRVKELN